MPVSSVTCSSVFTGTLVPGLGAPWLIRKLLPRDPCCKTSAKTFHPLRAALTLPRGLRLFSWVGGGSPFNPDSERQHLLFECGCDRGPPLTGSHKVPGVSSVTPENAALRCGPGRAGRRLPAPEEPGGSCASAVPGSPPNRTGRPVPSQHPVRASVPPCDSAGKGSTAPLPGLPPRADRRTPPRVPFPVW